MLSRYAGPFQGGRIWPAKLLSLQMNRLGATRRCTTSRHIDELFMAHDLVRQCPVLIGTCRIVQDTLLDL